jgi:hypothetical protein
MAKLFHELREHLLRAGVAPRHARRYLTELGDHLADLTAEEERAGRCRAEAESTALVRLGGVEELAKSMVGRREFQAWTAQAPWALFGLAPVMTLALAYFVACCYLWFVWKIFLPTADTPFGAQALGAGSIRRFENICFQAGKYYYVFAPVFVGWGTALMAGRQRLKGLWPGVGLVFIALMGGTAQIHAGRTAVPGGLGHIRMDFALGQPLRGIPEGLLGAMVILLLTAVPYLAWRLRQAYSPSA